MRFYRTSSMTDKEFLTISAPCILEKQKYGLAKLKLYSLLFKNYIKYDIVSKGMSKLG